MKYIKLFENEYYVGTHSAPTKQDAPMYDLLSSETYADDIYSSKALKMYGLGNPYDSNSIAIIQQSKGRPNYKVKIYRAIPPPKLTNEQQIDEYIKQKAYIQKNGKIPKEANTKLSRSDYYEFISNEIDRLKQLPNDDSSKIKTQTINSGDWVSISKEYTVEHGKSNLGNKFKILSKTVPAKTLFTDGNSIHEWGYQP